MKQEMKHELYESKKKAVKKSKETFRRRSVAGADDVDESETSALNECAPEEQVLLNTTEGAAISRRDVALHIEKMEQRFAMDLKELKNRLNVEQTDHSNNSDTSNNSSIASQCSAT